LGVSGNVLFLSEMGRKYIFTDLVGRTTFFGNENNE
jgi:hypothetical protein